MWLKAQRHFSLCPPVPSVIKREPMTTLQPYEYQGKYPGWQILLETQMAYVRRRRGEKKVKLASVLFWGRCEILILIDENVFDLKIKKNPAGEQKMMRCCKTTGVSLSASQQGTPDHPHLLSAHFQLLLLKSSQMYSNNSRWRSSLLLSASVAYKKMSVFVNHISFWSLVLCALSVCAVCRVVLWCTVLTAHRSFDSSLKPFCMFFLWLWCSCFLPQSKVMHLRLIENS